MIAVVHEEETLLDETWGVHEGDRVEVVGWVEASDRLRAVVRDDYGAVRSIPARILRLEPAVKPDRITV